MPDFTGDIFDYSSQQMTPYEEPPVSEAPKDKSATKFAEIPDSTVSSKYKRLQVNRIWFRTLIEMVCIITALILCCTLIITRYEDSFEGYTRKHIADNNLQLAHFISSMADTGAAALEDDARREYAQSQLSSQLDNCFISEDMLYSAAVYRVNGEEIELFASSSEYTAALQEGSIIDEEGIAGEQLSDLLNTAACGEEVSAAIGDIYLSLVPRTDSDGLVHSIGVASTTYRASLDYPSIVRRRLVWISVVCSLLIIIYYSISAARSEKKRQKAGGKDVVR